MSSAARPLLVLGSLVFQLSQGYWERQKYPSSACLCCLSELESQSAVCSHDFRPDGFSHAIQYTNPTRLLSILVPRNDFLRTQLNLHTGILILPPFAQLWLICENRICYTKYQSIDNHRFQSTRASPCLREHLPLKQTLLLDSEKYLGLPYRCQASSPHGQLAGHLRTHGFSEVGGKEGSCVSAHRCCQYQCHPSGQLAHCPSVASSSVPPCVFPATRAVWVLEQPGACQDERLPQPLPSAGDSPRPLTPAGLGLGVCGDRVSGHCYLSGI